ncbi:hypothetical protein SPAN111604_02385 [Sphingomonas antarctica]
MTKYALAFVSLLALAAPGYANTATISYVETSPFVGSADPVVDFTSGHVAYQDIGGALNRAVTSIGTNKVYSRGNGTSELNAGSAWMDSYTVGGTGNVNVHLSFTIDGGSNVGANLGGDGNLFDWTYRVVALKGGNWNLGGQGVTATAPGTNGLPIRSSGDNYESMLLTRTAPADATVTNTYQPRFGGTSVWNVRNFGGDPGQFASGVARNGNNVTVYTINPSGVPLRQVFQPTRLMTYNYNTGVLMSTVQYSAVPSLVATYNNLIATYPIFAQTGLCTPDDETGYCPTQANYAPTTLSLDFSVAAGEQFTVLSYLSHINLRDGEFDFFNTATLSGITLSPGATLTSSSGALQQMAGGGYGYAPLTLGVPEPAQWALMIGGFGLIGGASRRRQRQAASAASIAVGAPRKS